MFSFNEVLPVIRMKVFNTVSNINDIKITSNTDVQFLFIKVHWYSMGAFQTILYVLEISATNLAFHLL